MARKISIRGQAGELNSLFFKCSKSNVQQKDLDALRKGIKKFEERLKRVENKHVPKTGLIKFNYNQLDRIQERINLNTGNKQKPGMVKRFPKIKGSRVMTRARA